MADEKFKGSVKVQHPEDRKTKVEVTYKAETDKDGGLTVKLQVEGERATQVHTIREAMEQEEAAGRDARKKLQEDIQKAIQNQAEDILNNRAKSSSKVFKSMSDYIRS